MHSLIYRLLAPCYTGPRSARPEPAPRVSPRHLTIAWEDFMRGDHGQARLRFAAVLTSGPDIYLESQARLGLGMCWEELGDLARACAAYEEFLDRCAETGLLDVVCRNLIRCREALQRTDELARGVRLHPCHEPIPGVISDN